MNVGEMARYLLVCSLGLAVGWACGLAQRGPIPLPRSEWVSPDERYDPHTQQAAAMIQIKRDYEARAKKAPTKVKPLTKKGTKRK